MREFRFSPTTIIVFAMVIISQPIYAQGGWTRFYKGGYGNCIQLTSDGGYITVAATIIYKLDSYGNIVWMYDFIDDGVNGLNYVLETNDGGYVLTGSTEYIEGNYYDVFFAKLSNQGNLLWIQTYGAAGADVGYSLHQTEDGGYVIAGCKGLGSHITPDFWLIKTDSLGNMEWSKLHGEDDNDDRCYAMAPTSSGSYILAGWGTIPGNSQDFYIIKTDSAGELLWTHSYGGEDWDVARDVKQTSDGGYVVVGYTDSFGGGDNDLWLLKLDSLGDTIWTRLYGTEQSEVGWSVEEMPDGTFMVVGSTDWFAGSGKSDLWLLKLDSQGDTSWTRTYGGTYDDAGNCIRRLSDGGFIISGGSWSFSHGGVGLWLLKIDSLGRLPLEVSATKYFRPGEDDHIDTTIIPRAQFTNLGTEESVDDFYCCCKIKGVGASSSYYYDEVRIRDEVGPMESIMVEFEPWEADTASEFEATFYAMRIDGDSLPSRPVIVRFYAEPYVSIREQMLAAPFFELFSAIGRQIVLRYSDYPQGFAAQIFDATGRKVDEVNSNLKSGTIEWGEGFNSGVYFVRVEDGSLSSVQKVVLIR